MKTVKKQNNGVISEIKTVLFQSSLRRHNKRVVLCYKKKEFLLLLSGINRWFFQFNVLTLSLQIKNSLNTLKTEKNEQQNKIRIPISL